MKFFKNTFFAIILMVFIPKTIVSQCSLFYFFTNDYDCINNQSSTSFTISGATAPYTCTFVSTINSSTVAIGTTIGNTGTVTSIPVGSYSVFMTSANNCSGFTMFTVSLPFSPSNIVFTNTNVSCFGGSDGASSANVNNTFFLNPFTYTWSSGSHSQIANNLSANTVYSVTIMDSKGCMVTNSIVLTEPLPITSDFTNTFIPCFGTSINTTITSTGGTPAFTYSVDGNACVGNTASNLFAGTHTITAKDSKGCIYTASKTITQVTQPIITFSITKPSCPGKSDGSIISNISIAPPPYSFTWQPITANTPTLLNIPIGNYTLSIKDGSNCVTKSIAVVLPAASMSITTLTKAENCSAVDGAVTITISGGNIPFSFTTQPFIGSHTTNTLNILSTGSYTTIIKDANNCLDTIKYAIGNLSTVSVSVQSYTPILCYNQCNGSIHLSTLNAILPVTYSVSNTPTTSSSIISNLCAGFYVINAKDAIGCPATTTVNLLAPPIFSYSATAPTAVCYGKLAQLQATAMGGAGNYNYVWNPGNIIGQLISVTPTISTTYSLNVYDANGCTLAPYQVSVNVIPPISINVNSSNAGICPGSTTQITPTITGGDGNYSYNWQPGSLNVSSIFVQNVSVPVYTLTVNDGCGSPTAVKVIPINLFTISKPNYSVSSNTGCKPLCVIFTNTTPKSTNIIWNYGDKPFEQIGNTTNYCYEKSGLYNLKISLNDSNNCKTSFTYTNAIHVLESPIADFINTPNIITLNNSQNVTLKSTSFNADSFDWTINNNFISTAKDITYSFSDTGCYLISLAVKNNNNCRDTVNKYICVAEGFNFYMPNCVTINNDKLNEVLLPLGTGWTNKNYLFEIYNRWGHKIFKTNDYTVGWDAKSNQKNDPLNIYFWHVIITDNIDEIHELKGYVNVLH